jgi:hypothetical protein
MHEQKLRQTQRSNGNPRAPLSQAERVLAGLSQPEPNARGPQLEDVAIAQPALGDAAAVKNQQGVRCRPDSKPVIANELDGGMLIPYAGSFDPALAGSRTPQGHREPRCQHGPGGSGFVKDGQPNHLPG